MYSINNLKIPAEYKYCLSLLLSYMQNDKRIERIFLFGSCAKEIVHHHSDIDIAIITKEQLSIKEEMSFYDYLMLIEIKDYIPCDMIVMSKKQFEAHKESAFYVQKYIFSEGVELLEPLRTSM